MINLLSSSSSEHHHSRKQVALKPKYKYGKKPDPGAPKITRPCTECGKKFWSWKALFGHMRCHPERQWRGINPPPNVRRQQQMTEEDHEVAACLLLLANANGDTKDKDNIEMSASVSSHQEQEQCFLGCNKVVFGSYLHGGHKNVKGSEDQNQMMMMMMMDDHDSNMLMLLGPGGGGGGHTCSICLRVFSSGQALGGHKRCHWDKDPLPSSNQLQHQGCVVDLNLPPSPSATASATAIAYSSSPLALDLSLRL